MLSVVVRRTFLVMVVRHVTPLTVGKAFAPFFCAMGYHPSHYAEFICCRQACAAQGLHVHLQAAQPPRRCTSAEGQQRAQQQPAPHDLSASHLHV